MSKNKKYTPRSTDIIGRRVHRRSDEDTCNKVILKPKPRRAFSSILPEGLMSIYELEAIFPVIRSGYVRFLPFPSITHSDYRKKR